MSRRHVLLYEPQFAALVITGAKRCTIRKRRFATPRPGELLDHRAWHGVPYRAGSRQSTVRRGPCTSVKEIEIGSLQKEVRVDGVLLSEAEAATLARADGFESLAEFWIYFADFKNARPFHGVLIGWDK